jgi:hypothetical protein
MAAHLARVSVPVLLSALAPWVAAEDALTIDAQAAGISGFRAHWDAPIPLADGGARTVVDTQVKDRGQTAAWRPDAPTALSFDAVHRQLLVRFPGAAERIAAALAAGKAVTKVEIVLPFADEEIWPQGRQDVPVADGYRYRANWECDAYYRGVVRAKTPATLAYREQRPNWHAVAYALRRPWHADATTGPTFNAAICGAVYWTRFGAADTATDRFPERLGPAEVSSYNPEGRLEITALATDAAYGATLGERLRRLADCGVVISKLETYDARYYNGPYEFTTSTGGRAIIIRQPQLVVTLRDGPAADIALPPAADIPALAAAHAAAPVGAPTAVVPSPAEIAALDERFLAKPAWMPDWQYAHVRQLMGLASEGRIQPFYYRLLPEHAVKRAIEARRQQAGGRDGEVAPADLDRAVYLAWVDWNQGRQPRWYEGHLTAASAATEWFGFREALPEAVRDTVRRGWDAWLMPDRATAATDAQRKDFADTSGQLIHPMADDPRVGLSNGTPAVWNQGDTYYRTTGDWRGNKSFFRSGFTRMGSTANFNSTAVTGALLGGQIAGSEAAIADGSAGLMRFPFWQWTWNAGVSQEYIDHYYWAIATAGNKQFADFTQRSADRMAGWSIIQKTVNDLAMGYHPGLRKLIGPASRTFYEHVLGQQDGLYHILHTLSPQGALRDVDTGTLPELTASAELYASVTPKLKDGKQPKAPAPISAWGHDYPPAMVAQNTLSGPWADPWMSEWIDEKPLPWYALAEKKTVNDGDLVTTWFGLDCALASIRATDQRIRVQGSWRRTALAPSSMRDLGSLDVRLGFNQTQFANDSDGVITRQGDYRIAQHRNAMLLIARPNPSEIARRSGEFPFNQVKLPAQEITCVQCTVGLFNFERPAPTWTIRIDGAPIAGLPATAKTGQLITIHDGVSYLAIRALPTTDLGRDAEVTLETGQPQTQPYHERTSFRAALQIHANLYRRSAPLPKDQLSRLQGACTGFAIVLGDEAGYGTFARFEEHTRAATVRAVASNGAYTATMKNGPDTLTATWPAPAPPAESDKPMPKPADPPFTVTVNGTDPYDALKAARLWQDTPLGQIGLGRRLEKAGALIERAVMTGNNPMMLQVFPRQQVAVCTNPVPGYKAYRFRTPAGVTAMADGLVSMSQWAVIGNGEIRVRTAPFQLEALYMPQPDEVATTLFVTGMPGRPRATVNDAVVDPVPYTWEGAAGWLIPLAGQRPDPAVVGPRLSAALALITAPTPSVSESSPSQP